MINKRLFTFGCSHTAYHYPTWADIIAQSFKRHYNFGVNGAGNFFILTQLYEAHEMYNFNENDVVLIMLSSDDRGDFITPKNKWSLSGGIYNQANIETFGLDFMKNIWSEAHGINQGWIFTQSMFNFLNGLKCEFKLYSAYPPETSPEYKKISDRKFRYIQGSHLMKYKDMDNSYFFQDDEKDELHKDGHLRIHEHYNWVKDNAREYLLHELDDLIKDWESKITQERRTIVSQRFPSIIQNIHQILLMGELMSYEPS